MKSKRMVFAMLGISSFSSVTALAMPVAHLTLNDQSTTGGPVVLHVRGGETVRISGSCGDSDPVEVPVVTSEAFIGWTPELEGDGRSFQGTGTIDPALQGEFPASLRCSGGNPNMEPVTIVVDP